MRRLSRRRLLATLGSGTPLGLAGCLSGPSANPRYRLTAETVPGSLAEDLRWEPRGPFPAADRDLMARLVAEGELTTAGFSLVHPERPYVEHDGTYYEVAVDQNGTVDREHWILWFDLLDGDPPTDAEVYTSSLGHGDPTDLAERYGLSERDVRVVTDAAGEIPREFDFHDPEDDPPGRRGHVFLRRGPDETDLLPDPPFTHVAFEMGDGTRYARVVTERATVELQQYRYTATAVAESPDAYADYVREHHLAATFDRGDLTEEQRSVLETVTTGGRRYEETPPPSDALETILERLGLDDTPKPEPGTVEFSAEVYFEYDDGYYTVQLERFG